MKGNQGSLEEEVHATCKRNTPVSDSCTVEKGHGRILVLCTKYAVETRRCEVFEKGLMVDDENRWEKLTSVIKITATREFSTGKMETNERYYTSYFVRSTSMEKQLNESSSTRDRRKKKLLPDLERSPY